MLRERAQNLSGHMQVYGNVQCLPPLELNTNTLEVKICVTRDGHNLIACKSCTVSGEAIVLDLNYELPASNEPEERRVQKDSG